MRTQTLPNRIGGKERRMTFDQWFRHAFGTSLPEPFGTYLANHPRGVENGYGPRLWPADRIREETQDRRLVEKGVCLIGASDSIRHILLRASDGKVFVVDSRNHRSVDATFACVDTLIGLLKLE
ncbi:hypothetical protein [Paraburkholderia sp. SIMBA_054]|uniref:hypothetical protein n=1 Tax=Paraburkholderia sp. SIMBA_054 TaxID=3085795 RepID=UPI00397D37C2